MKKLYLAHPCAKKQRISSWPLRWRAPRFWVHRESEHTRPGPQSPLLKARRIIHSSQSDTTFEEWKRWPFIKVQKISTLIHKKKKERGIDSNKQASKQANKQAISRKCHMSCGAGGVPTTIKRMSEMVPFAARAAAMMPARVTQPVPGDSQYYKYSKKKSIDARDFQNKWKRT